MIECPEFFKAPNVSKGNYNYKNFEADINFPIKVFLSILGVFSSTGCSILFRVLYSQFISATWNEYGHVTYIFKEILKGNSMQKKFAEKHNPY